MRKHVYGYTMVEILMVIVIAVILFGIGIPAFSTLIRGNAMTISIRQLTAKIQAARSYAVTNRCKVAIVFPAVGDTGFPKTSFFYSAYRVCIVSGDSSPFTFESWIDGEEWKRLPTGVLIRSFSTPPPLPKVDGCIVTDSGGTCSFARSIIFKADGQMSVTSEFNIYLAYGRYISGAAPIYTEMENEKAIRHPIKIHPFTGKVTVKDAEEVP